MIPPTGRSLSGLRPFFLSTEGKEHANGEILGNAINLRSHYCKRSIKRGLMKKKFKEKQKCENERRFIMAANVENMFYVRTAPWHGLGTKVQEAPNSERTLSLAGLDWKVVQEEIYTPQQEIVEGYKANIRESDRKVLGVVTDRYKVIHEYSCAAEPPVQCGVSHLSRRTEPLFIMKSYSRNDLSNPYTSLMEIS